MLEVKKQFKIILSAIVYDNNKPKEQDFTLKVNILVFYEFGDSKITMLVERTLNDVKSESERILLTIIDLDNALLGNFEGVILTKINQKEEEIKESFKHYMKIVNSFNKIQQQIDKSS
jgi:hypothetical protein